MTRTTLLRILKIAGIVIIAAIIIAFAVSRSLNYARGPVILITEPANGSSALTTMITVAGKAERVNSLSLNGQAISVDEQGNFSESVTVFPGLNVLSLEAQDQFGRKTRTDLTVVGTKELAAQKPVVKTVPATGTTTASQ